MSDLAARIRAINETVEACRHGNADGLTIAMILDSTAKRAGELLMNNAPTLLAGLAALDAVPRMRDAIHYSRDTLFVIPSAVTDDVDDRITKAIALCDAALSPATGAKE